MLQENKFLITLKSDFKIGFIRSMNFRNHCISNNVNTEHYKAIILTGTLLSFNEVALFYYFQLLFSYFALKISKEIGKLVNYLCSL